MPDYTLIGPDGPIRLVDVFDGRSQLIVYNHMWFEGEEWQCGGCTSLTSQWTRLGILDNYDARFVIVTNGPIDEALAYKAKVGNKMDWYSSSESSFGADVDARRARASRSTCSSATATRFTAPGTPTAAAPSSSATPSRWSTSCRGAARRIGRIPRTGGRSRPPTPSGSTRPTSPGFTARTEIASDRTTQERYVVTRTIPAAPAEVFAVLTDPTRHKDTEPGDWVRDAVDTELITAQRPDVRGEHVSRPRRRPLRDAQPGNRIRTDRTIAWLPGQLDASGRHSPGGWWWRYDLTPNGAGTDVTLTYDWSETEQDFRDNIGVPVFEIAFIEDSLASLERAIR